MVSRWAPLLHNLGNCYRKLGELSKSVEFHQRAMSISPPSADSHALLGFSLALKGELVAASEQFQFGLSLNRHDQFTQEMLKNVMDEITKDNSLAPPDSDSEDEVETAVNLTRPNTLCKIVHPLLRAFYPFSSPQRPPPIIDAKRRANRQRTEPKPNRLTAQFALRKFNTKFARRHEHRRVCLRDAFHH